MTACDTFLSAFSEVTGTGNFHSTGIARFFFPELHVKGHGELAFPLAGSQAEALITLAEAAPYGMGEDTVLDENVRKCLELDNSPAPEILTFAKTLLAAEVARPLEPYPDWTRPCPQPAARAHKAIDELAAFMADPAAESHRFARPEHERRLVEGFIRDYFLDHNFITIQQSRPYTLVCTKNDKSHQHALDRRAKDKVLLAKLTKA